MNEHPDSRSFLDVKTCVLRNFYAYIREAELLDISNQDIRITARTMLRVGGFTTAEFAETISHYPELLSETPQAKEVMKEYVRTLKIVRE